MLGSGYEARSWCWLPTVGGGGRASVGLGRVVAPVRRGRAAEGVQPRPALLQPDTGHANCLLSWIILISVQRLGESVDLNNSTLISHSEWLIIEEMIAMQSNCKLEGLLGDML